jgi:hypothetical protein
MRGEPVSIAGKAALPAAGMPVSFWPAFFSASRRASSTGDSLTPERMNRLNDAGTKPSGNNLLSQAAILRVGRSIYFHIWERL